MSEKLLDLDALEKLAREATPGPWHCHKKDEQREEFLMDFGGMFDKDGNHTGRPAMSGWISLRDRDAPYIAAANPDAILALIARIRELESASQLGGGDSPDYNRGYADGKRDTRFVMLSEGFRKPVEGSQPGGGWRQIETAPKDCEVWAFNGEQGRMQWSEGTEWALWVWCDALLSDADPDPEQPTHWMPLPAAPSAGNGGTEKS